MGYSMARKTGIVRWFNRLKGFGFIQPQDEKDADIFVHYSQIEGEGYRNLFEGDPVSYEEYDAGKGPQARKVRR